VCLGGLQSWGERERGIGEEYTRRMAAERARRERERERQRASERSKRETERECACERNRVRERERARERERESERERERDLCSSQSGCEGKLWMKGQGKNRANIYGRKGAGCQRQLGGVVGRGGATVVWEEIVFSFTHAEHQQLPMPQRPSRDVASRKPVQTMKCSELVARLLCGLRSAYHPNAHKSAASASPAGAENSYTPHFFL
jgi:hypothetical protein